MHTIMQYAKIYIIGGYIEDFFLYISPTYNLQSRVLVEYNVWMALSEHNKCTLGFCFDLQY